MPRLAALLAIVLLLLPSSLSAVVQVVEDCTSLASAAGAAHCCCAHPDTDDEQGPYLTRSCCCAVDLPLDPVELPSLPRILHDSNEPVPADGLTSEHLTIAPPVDLSSCRLLASPPRAPPGSILVRLQRFLL